jgi:hypothetical protein
MSGKEVLQVERVSIYDNFLIWVVSLLMFQVSASY